MKIIALDVGDVHTGVAYADDLGIIATPYTTVATESLFAWIANIINTENLGTIIVGYPKTLKGTESAQTKKIVALFESLKKEFPTIIWKLFDERLTSKQAQRYMREQGKKSRHSEHALAAAIILQTYLDAVFTSRANNS